MSHWRNTGEGDARESLAAVRKVADVEERGDLDDGMAFLADLPAALVERAAHAYRTTSDEFAELQRLVLVHPAAGREAFSSTKATEGIE